MRGNKSRVAPIQSTNALSPAEDEEEDDDENIRAEKWTLQKLVLHTTLRIFLFCPIALIYMLLAIVLLWPLRILEARLHAIHPIAWESLPAFKIQRAFSKIMLALLGIRVRVRGVWPQRAQINTHQQHAPSFERSNAADDRSNAADPKDPKDPKDPEDPERQDRLQPMLVAFNHGSLLDGLILAAASPISMRFVAKNELIYYPLLNIALAAHGAIFIPRAAKDRTRAVAALSTAARVMKTTHCSIAISPEGTRTRTGRLGPFKKGPFYLARETCAPILPVAIRGAYQICPPGCLFPRPGAVEVVAASPVISHPRKDPRPPKGSFAMANHVMANAAMGKSADVDGDTANSAQEARIRTSIAIELWDKLRDLMLEFEASDQENRPRYAEDVVSKASLHAMSSPARSKTVRVVASAGLPRLSSHVHGDSPVDQSSLTEYSPTTSPVRKTILSAAALPPQHIQPHTTHHAISVSQSSAVQTVHQVRSPLTSPKRPIRATGAFNAPRLKEKPTPQMRIPPIVK
eukprot:TRINITY_DN1798_c0_g3_i1.p1 TRINITY_DN1798_c0_g3~~TRINITY_DN1798_c0_g3_i1.p1  ORF type:complete len:518 (-),score=102.06 TRINITY_DN1798_c0_g3_i1:30-1583(-)